MLDVKMLFLSGCSCLLDFVFVVLVLLDFDDLLDC